MVDLVGDAQKLLNSEFEDTIFVPAEEREFSYPFTRPHDVEDDIFALCRPQVYQELAETGVTRFYCAAIRSNGNGCIWPSVQREVPFCGEEKAEWLAELCFRMNDLSSRDGFWVLAWIGRSCFSALWFDRDGDLNARWDHEEPFWRMSKAGHDVFCKMADQAITAVEEHMHDMDFRDGELVKVAQGERPDPKT